MAKRFKKVLLERLAEKLNKKQLELISNNLASGFQRIGDIAILTLNQHAINERLQKIIAETMLKLFPQIKTVCVKTGSIIGQYRKPQIKVIASKARSRKTETIHTEYGCKYKFDVAKIMWSKGNINERVRIAKAIRPGSIVVDMFAGIGYFSIPIAKLSKAKHIYAIEINKTAFNYLQQNIKLNNIKNITAINDDCRNAINKLKHKVKADHIVMGLLPSCKQYLSCAMQIAKKGTIIHYEGLSNNQAKNLFEEVKEEAQKHNFKAKLLYASKVKSYKPKLWHYTVDVMLT